MNWDFKKTIAYRNAEAEAFSSKAKFDRCRSEATDAFREGFDCAVKYLIDQEDKPTQEVSK